MSNSPDRLNVKANSFVFSFDMIQDAERDLDLRIEAAEEAINKIVDICTIKTAMQPEPWQIIRSILQLCTDKEELKQLGKGLMKVAPIVEELDELKKRSNFIKLAHDQQSWVMSSFGDFSPEFDNFDNIDHILEALGDDSND